jgi:hypothetical protein
VCAALAIFLYTIPAVAIPDGWAPWENYADITGVGSISKVSPANTDWLHWNYNGGGETASFSIALTDPTDLDHRKCYKNNQIVKEETVDFGITTPVSWAASVGTINNQGAYTPPTSTNNSVTISCTVYDGGGYGPESVFREWGSQLKVFKVGVQVQPANATIWEDDTGEHLWTKYADGNDLEAYRETTFLNNSGDYEDQAAGWALSCSWTSCTLPGSGGQDIQGTINFTPEIKASGLLELEGMGDGNNSNACETLTSAIAAAGAVLGNPYVAAGASAAFVLAGGGSNINIGFAGDAAIQYIADKQNTAEVENEDFGLDFHYTWQYLTQCTLASALNVSGGASLKGDVERLGSAKVGIGVGIRDSSVLMWHAGRTYTVGTTYLKYGTSTPTYSGQ